MGSRRTPTHVQRDPDRPFWYKTTCRSQSGIVGPVRSRVGVTAYVIGMALALTACAADSSGAPTQSLTPSGSGRPPASMCDEASLVTGDKAPWDVRRGPVEGEPFGKTYITTYVQLRVTVSCTGGNWQMSMAAAGGEWLRVTPRGDAGPFGPYAQGQILTFAFSWPEGANTDATLPAHLLINGLDVGFEARNWSQVDTTWAGPTLGEPTMTFPPPAN